MWLARAIDKGRAHAAGTIGEYVYPCPIDRGVMERWGITPEEFDAALRDHTNDASMLNRIRARVPQDRAVRANSWVCVEKFENLERQDREEGAFGSLAS